VNRNNNEETLNPASQPNSIYTLSFELKPADGLGPEDTKRIIEKIKKTQATKISLCNWTNADNDINCIETLMTELATSKITTLELKEIKEGVVKKIMQHLPNTEIKTLKLTQLSPESYTLIHQRLNELRQNQVIPEVIFTNSQCIEIDILNIFNQLNTPISGRPATAFFNILQLQQSLNQPPFSHNPNGMVQGEQNNPPSEDDKEENNPPSEDEGHPQSPSAFSGSSFFAQSASDQPAQPSDWKEQARKWLADPMSPPPFLPSSPQPGN
jgi:hypothetical protein